MTWAVPPISPSAGVFRIRSSSRAPVLLGRDGQRPVFDEGAGIAQIGQIFPRGAMAVLVAAGHRVGTGVVEDQRLAVEQFGQVGPNRRGSAVATDCACGLLHPAGLDDDQLVAGSHRVPRFDRHPPEPCR